MSKEHDLPSDSDDDDEDYIPGGAESEAGSEVESDGEAESGPEDDNDENVKSSESGKKGKGKKRGVRNKGKSRKKLKKNISEEPAEEVNEAEKKLSEEEEKKRADSLWADFMKDTPAISKPRSKDVVTSNSKEPSLPSIAKKDSSTIETVKITKLFEFAGEEVKVEKEVAADSAEARLSLTSSEPKSDPISTNGPKGRGFRRGGGLGGISSVLGQLGKKAKISTLEKSKLDWDSYKKEKNIEEEINTHNKGKDGYLEKQDFLQRADIRQFEIEKQLRSSRRSSR